MTAGDGAAAAQGVWFSGPREVEVRGEDVRDPGEGEVTVRAQHSLISPGTELNYYRGDVPPGIDVGLPTVSVGPERFPVKFGYSCVGTVTAAGPGAKDWIGRTVFARHPHQDHFTLPISSNGRLLVRQVPDGLDPRAATFTNLVDVALNALLDVPVMIGDSVVVFGCGIVGLSIMQLARRTAGHVIAVDPLPNRRSLALELGADLAVAPDEVGAAVSEGGDGAGVDVCFEASGAGAALQQAIDIASKRATIGVASFYGERPVSLRLTPEFHFRSLRLVSTMIGSINPELTPRWTPDRRGTVAMSLLPELHVDRMITHEIPFADAARAFEVAADSATDSLGVLLDYPSSD